MFEGVGMVSTAAPRPARFERGAPVFYADDIDRAAATEINSEGGAFFTRGAKKMSTDFDNATQMIEGAQERMSAAITALRKQEEAISEGSKRVSQNVRKAANDMAEGLNRISKLGDFNNLERYVTLLERAAGAMTVLADLEKDGKLAKITAAVKG